MLKRTQSIHESDMLQSNNEEENLSQFAQIIYQNCTELRGKRKTFVIAQLLHIHLNVIFQLLHSNFLHSAQILLMIWQNTHITNIDPMHGLSKVRTFKTI